MEREVRFRQWKNLAGELKACGKQLRMQEAELEALYSQMKREGKEQHIRKQISKQQQTLSEQRMLLQDLYTVFVKTASLYETCEERILQAQETDGRQFREKLRVTDLKEFARISAVLK